jgi:hypothetical protein
LPTKYPFWVAGRGIFVPRPGSSLEFLPPAWVSAGMVTSAAVRPAQAAPVISVRFRPALLAL